MADLLVNSPSGGNLTFGADFANGGLGFGNGTNSAADQAAAVQASNNPDLLNAAPVDRTLGVTTSRPAPSGGTGSTGGSAASSGPSQAQLNDLYNSGAAGINRQYDQINASLDAQAGYLPEQQNNLTNQVNTLYSGQLNDINSARAGANDALKASTDQVNNQEAQATQLLGQNISDAMDAGNAKLGGMGASDSSGADLYKYALTKLASQSRGQIVNQANQLLTQIGLKAADVKRTYDQQTNDLNTWKANQTQKIVQWATDNYNQLQQQKMQANAARQQDLTNLQMQLKAQAMQALQNVQSSYQTYQSAYDNWMTQHANSLSSMANTVQSGLQPVANVDTSVNTSSLNPVSDANLTSNLTANTGSGGASGVIAPQFRNQNTIAGF